MLRSRTDDNPTLKRAESQINAPSGVGRLRIKLKISGWTGGQTIMDEPERIYGWNRAGADYANKAERISFRQ